MRLTREDTVIRSSIPDDGRRDSVVVSVDLACAQVADRNLARLIVLNLLHHAAHLRLVISHLHHATSLRVIIFGLHL